MLKHNTHIVYLLPTTLLTLTAVATTLLSLPSTHATDSTSVEDTVRVVVDSSCGMSQTVLSSGTTMNPGESSTIGSSRIAAYCNDSNGYDIYAIGYTNGEYGNTNMKSTTTTTTIPTGTSGNTSYWNMTLSPGTATSSPSYIPTILSPFTTPTTIPTDYTKVATYPSSTAPQGTDPLTSGSYFTSTYSSHISTTQPAGVYTGQVQYVMVHPVGAPAPTFMQDTTAIKSRLTNIGDTMQAIDKRDGKKYWITKLADGNIWMTQNLDLDIVAGKTYTSVDTDLPEGATWVPSVSTYSARTYTWSWSDTTPESYDPGNRYWDGMPNPNLDGNIEGNTTEDPSLTPGGTHYHIGNYYNWTATAAMNDSSNYVSRQDANQSICPAGWRLPLAIYDVDKSYYMLIQMGHLTSGTSGNVHTSNQYFVYGGLWTGGYTGFSSSGYYWSDMANSASLASDFTFYVNNKKPDATGITGRSHGFSVRCVAR